jgi:signal peptidase I
MLLTCLVPGLGHLYAGRYGRAAGVTALGLAAYPILVAFISRAPLGLLQAALPILLALGALGWAARDAGRVARAGLADHRPSGIVLTAVGVALFLASDLTRSATRLHVAEAFRIPGGAMEPSVLPGDYLYAVPLRRARIDRGAPVIYRADGQTRLHRVAGLPGDTVAVEGGRLIRNGRRVAEAYTRTEPVPPGEPTRWGPVVVPSSHVVVLGDNRWMSEDSRAFGPVPLDSVLRRPTRVYFSRDPETGGVRWERTGRAVGAY